VVADKGHLRELRRWAVDDAASTKVRLLREFDQTAVASGTLEVDDPYFGSDEDFDICVSVVERACRGLVQQLRAELAEVTDLTEETELTDRSGPDTRRA